MASIPTKKPKNTNLKELKTLFQQLLSSRVHINNLPLLLTFVSPSSPPQHVLESLLSLQSFFITVLPDLPPSSSSTKRRRLGDSAKEDAEFIYRTWLRSKFDEFITLLIEVLLSPDTEEALREIVLDSFMEFVKLGNGGGFHSATYHKLLRGIVHSATPVEFLSELLASKYFKYIDIGYFTFISMEKLAKTLDVKDIPDDKTVGGDGESGSQSRESMELSIHKIHYIISHIPPLEGIDEKFEYEMWSGLGLSSKEEHDQKELSKLQKAEDKELKTEKRNNDVLSPATIAKKMKLKFTKAWISFLRLPIPADIYKEEDGDETPKDNSKAEDIVNKADDSGSGTEISHKRSGIDHFNNEESNPIKSNAMRSSLWDIDTLRHHYCPPVSRFVLSLENDLTVRSKTTEMDIKDFSSGSYATIFGDEIRRRVKQVPLAFYKATPTSLFSETECSGWTFKYEESKENDSGNKKQSIANTCEENDISTKRQRIECS